MPSFDKPWLVTAFINSWGMLQFIFSNHGYTNLGHCHCNGEQGPSSLTISVSYSLDGGSGTVGGGMLESLNNLIDSSLEEVEVSCCQNGVLFTYTCGNIIPCDNICGENNQSKLLSLMPSSQSSLYSGSSILDINDVVRGICQTEGSLRFNIPIWNLWYCPRRVTTPQQLDKYSICCLHPYTYRRAGVKDRCCKQYGWCV